MFFTFPSCSFYVGKTLYRAIIDCPGVFEEEIKLWRGHGTYTWVHTPKAEPSSWRHRKVECIMYDYIIYALARHYARLCFTICRYATLSTL